MTEQIRYLKHAEIDRDKYNACITRSAFSRIYAMDWYLDAVTDRWDVLVLNDYEAVMPLPVRKKYALHYIYQAPWVQQLGIFSKGTVSQEMVAAFLKKIPGKFILLDYLFHSGTPKINGFSPKVNYLLKLNRPFSEIVAQFNVNRRRIAKKGFKNIKVIEDNSGVDLIQLYQNTHKYKSHTDAVEKLQSLIKTGKISIFKVYEKEELVSGLLWVKNESRITYLLPAATEQAKKRNIPTLLVLKLIERFENSNYTLDFEGSMQEGVAKFYRSFGAEKEVYYQYRTQRFLRFFL